MKVTTHLTHATLVATLGLGLGFAAPNLALAQGSQGSSVERDHGKRHWHGKRGCRGKRGKGLYRALAKLDLTDNQRAQIDAIKQTAREQKRELREQEWSEEKRKEYRAIKRETRGLIRDVLTPEQREQLEQMREARKAKKLERKLGWMTDRLELTPRQQQRVRAALEAKQERRKAIRDNADTREDRREAMREVRRETREAIRAALTPEQAQKLDELKERRRGKRGWRGKRGKRGWR